MLDKKQRVARHDMRMAGSFVIAGVSAIKPRVDGGEQKRRVSLFVTLRSDPKGLSLYAMFQKSRGSLRDPELTQPPITDSAGRLWRPMRPMTYGDCPVRAIRGALRGQSPWLGDDGVIGTGCVNTKLSPADLNAWALCDRQWLVSG